MYIKNLNIYKDVRDNTYMNFFLLDHTKIQHVYRYYSTQNIIEISHSSGANIHINKYYSAKYYLAKCYKRKNSKYF